MPSDAGDAAAVLQGNGQVAVTAGHEASLGQLEEMGMLAFRVALGVLRHREDAEDVAQETMARAYRHRDGLRDPDRLRPWLVRIAWRLAIDQRRTARRREARERTFEATGRTAEETAAADDFRRRLWEAIDRLPEGLRMVIVMSGIEGHDVREVARALELPEGTVKSRLHAARRRLAEALR